MPDDRPVSPERLITIASIIAAGRARQHDAMRIAEDVVAALSTPAGPPGVPYDDDWRDNDEAQALIDAAAPSPREEAVEAPDERDVKQVARALEGVCDSTGRPMILRERQDLARGALFAVALSAARPSSPGAATTKEGR